MALTRGVATSAGRRPVGGLRRACMQRVAVQVRAKKGIHPEFHKESKVYCNGEEVFTVGGCAESYDVDVWSGNHPLFQADNEGSTQLVDQGNVTKFNDKFGGDLGAFGKVVSGTGGQEALKKFKLQMKKGKKKK